MARLKCPMSLENFKILKLFNLWALGDLKWGHNQKTREGCGCFRGLFGGSPWGPRKILGKSREIAGKFFQNREMLQILGFRAPGKANLPGTLCRHCLDLVPTFRAGCFLKSFFWLKATFSNSCTIVCTCAHLWPFGPSCKGNFGHKIVTIVGTCGQLRTSTLSPCLFESPRLDFPEKIRWFTKVLRGKGCKGREK